MNRVEWLQDFVDTHPVFLSPHLPYTLIVQHTEQAISIVS